MNAHQHAALSVQRRGGQLEDYYPLHSFLDSTKELCSDKRHRILHNLWGIRRVVIPIFGATIRNSDGQLINVKDLLEQDHLLADFGNKFVPTLADFVEAIQVEQLELAPIEALMKAYEDDEVLCRLLLSPLALTGSLKSLLLTHNSWFLNEIVPRVLGRKPQLQSFAISPQMIFTKMDFKAWMNNGESYPPSATKINAVIQKKMF